VKKLSFLCENVSCFVGLEIVSSFGQNVLICFLQEAWLFLGKTYSSAKDMGILYEYLWFLQKAMLFSCDNDIWLFKKVLELCCCLDVVNKEKNQSLLFVWNYKSSGWDDTKKQVLIHYWSGDCKES